MNFRIHSTCITALLVLAATAGLTAQNSVPLYGLQIIPTRAKAAVSVNGFPFAETSHLERTTSSGRVNRFLKRGENVIRIELDDTVIAQPEDQEVASQHIRVELQRRANLDEETVAETLFRVERQVDLGDKADSRTMEFLTVASDGGVREYRGPLTRRSRLVVDLSAASINYGQVDPPAMSVVEIHFSLPDFPLLSLPWLQGEAAMDGGGLQEVQAKAVAMRDAYAARDSNAVVAHFQPKLARMAVAQGIPAADLGGFLNDSYTQVLFTIGGLNFAPLSPEAVQVRAYPGINLVRAEVDGAAPIRASGDGWEFNLYLYFSKVGGAWQLVE